jgi:uncharacterized membrane protein
VTRGFWLGLAAAAVTFLVLAFVGAIVTDEAAATNGASLGAFARERASAAQRRR